MKVNSLRLLRMPALFLRDFCASLTTMMCYGRYATLLQSFNSIVKILQFLWVYVWNVCSRFCSWSQEFVITSVGKARVWQTFPVTSDAIFQTYCMLGHSLEETFCTVETVLLSL